MSILFCFSFCLNSSLLFKILANYLLSAITPISSIKISNFVKEGYQISLISYIISFTKQIYLILSNLIISPKKPTPIQFIHTKTQIQKKAIQI